MARAVVVGGGIGGLAAALALQRRGWAVTVHEREPALAPVGAGLALAPNALRALDALGVGAAVRSMAALQGEAGIMTPAGRWLSRTDAAAAQARFGDPTVVVHRAALVDLLAGALAPGTLRLASPVGPTALAGSDADLVVGADGLHSAVRRALFPDHPGPVYAGVTSWRIVVPHPGGRLHPVETWGRGAVFGVTELGDGRVYCYATDVAPPGGRAPDEGAELRRRFGGWPDPIPRLVAAAREVVRTDIRCLDVPLPRFHAGRTVLLGDAAHATTPNLGQGACQALEDAVVLAHHAGAPDGPARYSADRVPRTRAVALASRRVGRLTRLTHPAAVALRDAGMRLAGRLGPNVVLRRMDPVLRWRPP